MKPRKVIDLKNLPAGLPVTKTLLYILALSYFEAPGWAWGVMGTILAVIWVSEIYFMSTEERVDILKGKEE